MVDIHKNNTRLYEKTLRGDKQEKTTLHNKQGYTELTGQGYIDIVL